jgi:hypothetical protein
MSLTAYPGYENPKAGDRITIANDAQHYCLNAEGHQIVDGQFQPGEKIVNYAGTARVIRHGGDSRSYRPHKKAGLSAMGRL